MPESREHPGPVPRHPRRSFTHEVGSRERRKIHKRRWANQSPLFWVGMFGLVGWSVAIPTVIGVLLGLWMDRRWPASYSWTLMLLFIGLLIGCGTAWFWVRRESGLTGQDNGDPPTNEREKGHADER
ncbi:MAG: ATPase F0F1 [Phycisphaera sp.]|nr:ATPase F0F1 [Phycisphaera sp.]